MRVRYFENKLNIYDKTELLTRQNMAKVAWKRLQLLVI